MHFQIVVGENAMEAIQVKKRTLTWLDNTNKFDVIFQNCRNELKLTWRSTDERKYGQWDIFIRRD